MSTATAGKDPVKADSNSNVTNPQAAPPSTKQQQQQQQQATTTAAKVKVHFQAVGAAPLLKKAKFQLAADQRWAAVSIFLRKMLKLERSASLFLYCHSAFSPGPDEMVGDLRDAFAVRDELVIHYSLQEAWG